MSANHSSVLVVGAGPAGLALAIDMQRRGIDVRVVSAGGGPFPGSRAKGIQPRSLEVLDDLGVLDALSEHATTYPKLGLHLGPLTIKRTMIKLHEVTEGVPHPNTLLAGQYDTDAALLRRLESLGGRVEFGIRLTGLRQDAERVCATLNGPSGAEEAMCTYLVGADGGASAVRQAVGIAFEGTTDESDRMIVADLELTGLSRRVWHIWPAQRGRFMALCPLPGGELFQLMLKLKPDEPAETTPDALMAKIHQFRGARSVKVSQVRWSSVWRPNIRLAQRYRSGRVFLVGDAAHVHPPTGAQGLNTGVQDSYNLGWKLGQVLAGAPDALVDTYEDERQPVAAGVLGLATKLYASTKARPSAAMKRGDQERQLSLSYRGGPLAIGVDDGAAGLQPGDRVANVEWTDPGGQRQRLIDHLRGPHFTLLTLSSRSPGEVAGVPWPSTGAALHRVTIIGPDAERVADVYGIDQPASVLIRPDGYAALVSRGTAGLSADEIAALTPPLEPPDRAD